jgi:hypothetical protein
LTAPKPPSNCASCSGSGRKTQWISKVQIQGNDASLLQTAVSGDLRISGRAEALLDSGTNIVPSGSEQIPTTQAEVFIELELHATGSKVTGTMRSWDIAEP